MVDYSVQFGQRGSRPNVEDNDNTPSKRKLIRYLLLGRKTR